MTIRILDDLELSITAESYDRAKDAFVTLCRNAGVAHDRIGFFGTIGFPVVSDLDALVIGSNDQLREIGESLEQLRRVDPEIREIFWHPPVYVLESIRELAGSLHTLHGLTDVVRSQLGPIAVDSNSSYQRTLNHVWFSFLASVVATSLSRAQISLRLILLLHKNFEVSMDMFSANSPPTRDGSMRSGELRHLILGGEDHRTALYALRRLVDETLVLQDSFADWPYRIGATSIAIVRLTPWIVAARSRKSRMYLGRGLGVVSLSPGAYEPIGRTRREIGGEDDLSRYLSIARTVAGVYRREGMAYPFITPGNIALHRS